MEGFHYPYHPLHARLHELLPSGELGELRAVEIHMVMPAPDDGDPRWRLDLAGGGLMDVGCYGLHALRMLGGGARRRAPVVAARAGERDAGRRRVAGRRAGAPGRRPGDAAQRHERRPPSTSATGCVGRAGQAFAPDFPRPHLDDRIEVTGPDGTRVEELGRRSSYTYQLEALAAHLRDGAPLVTDADDAVANMELIDEVYRAAGLAPARARPVPPAPASLSDLARRVVRS